MAEAPTNTLFNNMQVLGSRQGAGEPVSTVPTLPDYIGQFYFDTTNANFYIATSLVAAGWKKMNA